MFGSRLAGIRGIACVAIAVTGSAVGAGEPLRLALPIDCDPRTSCFIQNYVDLDRGKGARDYACGSATYDGHSGVDFRLLSAAATRPGVAVLAAADGIVTGRRDGVEDVFSRHDNGSGSQGRECGNGVLIDHGDGWETQYCHLKKDSVAVQERQSVRRGDRLGDVGYSGATDMANLHFSVRKNQNIVDPFYPDATEGACLKGTKVTGLWQPDVGMRLAYKGGDIIDAGFAGRPPSLAELEVDHRNVVPATVDAPALVFFGRFINLRAGDRLRVVITGPGGSFTEDVSAPLKQSLATHLVFAGKTRKDGSWPAGHYDGRVEIIRDGAVIATRVRQTAIKTGP